MLIGMLVQWKDRSLAARLSVPVAVSRAPAPLELTQPPLASSLSQGHDVPKQ